MTNDIISSSSEPPGFGQTLGLGKVFVASGFFPDTRSAAQAAVKVIAGQELGFGPVASMTGIYLLKGRITLSANLMAAAIRRSAKYDYNIKHLDDTRCEIAISRDRDVIGVSTFTIEDAKRAGLTSGANWRSYPKNMLFARAISNAARWHTPDIFGGGAVYTPDELGAAVDGETGEVIALRRDAEREVTAPRIADAEKIRSLEALLQSKGVALSRLLAHDAIEDLGELTDVKHLDAVTVLEDKPDIIPGTSGEGPGADGGVKKEG